MMKVSFSNIVPIIILTFYLLSHVCASNSAIENFLQCLPFHSNPSHHPISKAIYTPSNSNFLNVLQTYIRESRFNTSSTPKPLAVVTALDISHVQATVMCAKSNGIQIRIRSGGHDYEGLSYVAHHNVPFIVLDMFNLRSIDIDLASETAWVQSGATLGELYYKIAQKSKVHAFPAGVCHTLGTGGHFTGGGYGNMLRRYGLSIDNIIDAQIVDANGRILDRQNMGEDLFWAIRGGGGASFCVILSWKIKLVRVPEIVTVFNVPKTLEQGATDIVLEWQQVASIIDSKLFIRVKPQVVTHDNDQHTTVQVSFIGLYLGSAKSLVSLLNKGFPLLGLKRENCIEMPWVETTLFWYEKPKGTPIESLLQRTPTPSNSFAKKKSDYVKSPIPRSGLETIWKKMVDLKLKYNSTMILQWNTYGGRMNEIHANATAFPHRVGNLFKIQYMTLWEDGSEETTRRNLQATRELHDTFTPYVSRNPREAFLNYRDIDIGTNLNGSLIFDEYFKDNVKRLLEVKAKVDPTNFFRHEQSIPVLSKKKVDVHEATVKN